MDDTLRQWFADHGNRGLRAVDEYLRQRSTPCTNMRKLGRKFQAAAGICPGYRFAFVPQYDGKVRLVCQRLPVVAEVEHGGDIES